MSAYIVMWERTSVSSLSKRWGTISRKVRPVLQAQGVQGNLENQNVGGINLDIPKSCVRVLFFLKKHPDFGIANLTSLRV